MVCRGMNNEAWTIEMKGADQSGKSELILQSRWCRYCTFPGKACIVRTLLLHGNESLGVPNGLVLGLGRDGLDTPTTKLFVFLFAFALF